MQILTASKLFRCTAFLFISCWLFILININNMENRNHYLKRMFISVIVLLICLPAIVFAADPAIPDGWTDGYLYANGIRIHYYHAAPAAGKPVILAVHGVMDIGLSWASVGTRLQKDYDIYMLDTRGHGLSDPFNGSEDRNTLLKDVMEASKALGLNKPILMGHSMGGAIVIRLGAEYPDFAKAIIVVDAGIGGGPRPQNNPRTANTVTQPAPTADSLSITMRGTPEALVKQNNYGFDNLVAKAHRDNPRWSTMDCQYWATAIKRYHGPYSDEIWQTMSATMRSDSALAKIQVPMIILKADASPEARKVHQQQASVMQKGKLVHIDNSGHNLQRDQPERAAEVIRDFLSKIK
jgi:pimeloyl-ACP methyl ester carboxylesterase